MVVLSTIIDSAASLRARRRAQPVPTFAAWATSASGSRRTFPNDSGNGETNSDGVSPKPRHARMSTAQRFTWSSKDGGASLSQWRRGSLEPWIFLLQPSLPKRRAAARKADRPPTALREHSECRNGVIVGYAYGELLSCPVRTFSAHHRSRSHGGPRLGYSAGNR